VRDSCARSASNWQPAASATIAAAAAAANSNSNTDGPKLGRPNKQPAKRREAASCARLQPPSRPLSRLASFGAAQSALAGWLAGWAGL